MVGRLFLVQIIIGFLFAMTLAGTGIAEAQEHPEQVVRPRNILILTSSFGGGHDSGAKVIAEALLKANPQLNIRIVDYADYLPMGMGKVWQKGYDLLVKKSPKLWDFIFRTEMYRARNYTTPGQITNPVNEKRFLKDIRDFQTDVVISTYFLAAARVAELRLEGKLKGPRTAWVHTDYVNESYFKVISVETDLTILPHPAFVENWLDFGISDDNISASGIPVSPEVMKKFTEKERADFLSGALQDVWVNGTVQGITENSISLQPDKRLVIVTGGSAGVGDFRKVIDGLIRTAKGPIQIVAITGKNNKMYRDLKKTNLPPGVLLAVEKTVPKEKMMAYLRSADGFIGKSGGLMTTEIAYAGLPSVLLNINLGPERHNSQFFKDQGLAVVLDSEENAGLELNKLLDDAVAVKKMKNAMSFFTEFMTLKPIIDFVSEPPQEGISFGCNGPVLKVSGG